MGGRRRTNRHRKTHSRQRSPPRNRRADPLVSRPHRHARRLCEGRDHPRNAGRAARPERPHRLGHDQRLHRRSGLVRRDDRPDRCEPNSRPTDPSRSPRATRRSTSRAGRRRPAASGRRGTGRSSPTSSGSRRACGTRQGDGPRLHRAGRSGHDGEGLMRVNAAHNWDEFLAALRLYQTPTQNLVYADAPAISATSARASCRCASQATGSRPPTAHRARRTGSGMYPSNNGRSCTILTPDSPSTPTTPSSPADHQPPLGQDWEEAFRARRIQQFFDTVDKHSLDNSAAMQADHVRSPPRNCCRSSRASTPSDERARQALALLAGWDGVTDRDRAGAADLHRLPQRVAPDHARREDRPFHERERPVRRDHADLAAARSSRPGATRRANPIPTAARRSRAPSTKGSRSSSSAMAPT